MQCVVVGVRTSGKTCLRNWVSQSFGNLTLQPQRVSTHKEGYDAD